MLRLTKLDINLPGRCKFPSKYLRVDQMLRIAT
jgi:hypothetical protein